MGKGFSFIELASTLITMTDPAAASIKVGLATVAIVWGCVACLSAGSPLGTSAAGGIEPAPAVGGHQDPVAAAAGDQGKGRLLVKRQSVEQLMRNCLSNCKQCLVVFGRQSYNGLRCASACVVSQGASLDPDCTNQNFYMVYNIRRRRSAGP